VRRASKFDPISGSALTPHKNAIQSRRHPVIMELKPGHTMYQVHGV